MPARIQIEATYHPSELLGGKMQTVEWFDDSKAFPDCEHLVVTGMRLFIGVFYGYTVNAGVEVFYSNGKSVLHGDAGYGMAINEFQLCPGERINYARVSHGGLIDNILFKTNRDNTLGPFGEGGGENTSVLVPPETTGYLAYVKGSIDRSGQWEGNCIRNLQFVWAVEKEQGH